MDWYIPQPVAWALVIGVVSLASALLSYLHTITEGDRNRGPDGPAPTEYDLAA